jgi:M6 family metalloprotease-like protein
LWPSTKLGTPTTNPPVTFSLIDMKKSNLIRSISIIASVLGMGGMALAAPYEPEGRVVTWGQGPPLAPTMQLSLRVFGDEFYGRTETLAGYTVIYNYADNSYYYAKLSDDGVTLESTGVLANLAPPANLQRRIDLSIPGIIQAAGVQRIAYDARRKARWDTRVAASQTVAANAAGTSFPPTVLAAARTNSAPVAGSVVGLTILVEFSDTTANFTQAKIQSMFNQGTLGAPGVLPPPRITPATAENTYTQDGNAGSVNTYFAEQSAGRLNLVQLVTPIVKLTGNRASYSYADYNPQTPTTSPNNELEPNARVVASEIIRDAITRLEEQGFNFSPVSVDAFGRIRVVNVILASPDSGAHMQGVWPHSGPFVSSFGATVTPDVHTFGTDTKPRIISEYAFRTVNTTPITIGTLCHDDAQLLVGFPDLYAYPSMGVGNQCLMGTGSDGSTGSPAIPATAATNGSATTPFVTLFVTPPVPLPVPPAAPFVQQPGLPAIPISSANGGRRPAPLNPHFKNLAGWNTPIEINATTERTVTLPTATPTAGVAYRFRKPGSLTESFIVENRNTNTRWIAAPLDTGVAVWHIDDSKNGNILAGPADNYGVSLEQADALGNLENSIVGPNSNAGDSGDLLKVARPTFSDLTRPSAAWWDGTPSRFQARVISFTGTTDASVAFGPYASPNSIVVDGPNGGEFAFWQNTIPITWSASITGNVKIELLKAGVPPLVIAANVVTSTRRFNWVVPTTVRPASDYTIRISSLTNAIAVSDTSDAPFTVSDVAFPRDQRLPHGWVKPTASLSTWTVSNVDAVDGSFCLAAIRPRDGSSAGIEYSSNFVAGEVSFYLKTSTEPGFDFARFYIDGVEQALEGSVGLSGQSEWLQYRFQVEDGPHTFKWVYEKDTSVAAFNDRVLLDAVVLPATKEEIAVETLNAGIESGASIGFADTTLGQTTAAQVFTIRNAGTTDLYGISLTKEGTNMADFVVTALPRTVLTPGATMTFSVTFKPVVTGLPGAKVASLSIRSSDGDESPFTVALQGTADAIPSIAVSEPSGTAMIDGRATRAFGSASIGSTGTSRVFTIRNNGAGPLKSLAVTKTGAGIADFEISPLSATTVASQATATFTITFKPTLRGARSAAIKITSNDVKAGPFDFTVSGTGLVAASVARTNVSSTVLGQSFFLQTSPVGPLAPFTQISNGLTYNVMTIAKGTGTVEVSSNLVDWFSGKDFTTVVSETDSSITVRDNTPTSELSKRYIRRK